MDLHFKCTQCGKCCRDLRIPLTVAEAAGWLNRGHAVQLLCEASPWPEALDDDARAQHFRHRSFAAVSGSMPTRIVVMLVANVVGTCPNLLATMSCGIYDDRPLVCRIYPAEINPLIPLERDRKICPPEAWTTDHPVLQRNGHLMDVAMRQDIETWRAADALDAEVKRRLCIELNVTATALVHEAVLVYSPSADTLLSALTSALASAEDRGPHREATVEWRFISSRSDTIANVSKSGGVALHLSESPSGSFQLFGSKREPIFGFDADWKLLPPVG